MPPRSLWATVLVAIVSVASIGRYFFESGDAYAESPTPDSVTEFDQRFAELRKMLPGRGVIGYVTDPGIAPDDGEALAEYYLTEYALTPHIVVRSEDQRFLVGNFHKEITVGSLADRGFKLVRQFGNGIVLLEKNGARP